MANLLLHLAAIASLAACGASAPRPASPPPATTDDGAHDFDFHLGTWRTQVRRLAAPLSGSSEWVDYQGTTVVRPIWGGRANLVELVADGAAGAAGAAGHLELLSLRLFDPTTHRWSLYVASSRGGGVGPPVVGGFVAGRGEFVGEDTFGGRAILVRFVITEETADRAHFEQAFSGDGGATWEVNWIATDTRVNDDDTR
jgi:hypothetical protein